MGYIGNAPGQKDIAAYTNIGAAPAETDELLISDAGVLKAITVDKLLDPAGYTNIGAQPAGSDELLLSDAGVLKAVTVDNLIAGAGGGLGAASTWRLTTDFDGAADPIASNLEVDDTYGSGSLGSAMTQSSGVFTFPSTGYWLVEAVCQYYYTSGLQWHIIMIKTTTDGGSNWDTATDGKHGQDGSSNYFAQAQSAKILDDTNTSNVKVKFSVTHQDTNATTKGSTSQNITYFNFLKLGDT